MIEYIIGRPADVTPTYAVLDNNGIGYGLNITVLDYPKIEGRNQVKLYVYEVIREDVHELYGFLERHTRELFELLTSVSGVGPNTARLILSSMTPAQLESAIAAGQDSALKAVKGIGGKTAQRIIVDLKDKIKVAEEAFITSTPAGESYDDAVAAMVMLGFTQQQSQKVMKKIFSATPAIGTEAAIKQALTML